MPMDAPKVYFFSDIVFSIFTVSLWSVFSQLFTTEENGIKLDSKILKQLMWKLVWNFLE